MRSASFFEFLLGKPLASDEQERVKIGVVAGVPAMGLDGLTSSAYGPEAALTVLAPLGAVGLHYITPIMAAILVLLAMLYFSYRQTVAAYPVNGGSYTVATKNLGAWAGLLAAAALMIDYTLNVAVGISAGVAALVSAAPALHRFMLPMCLGILALITLLNLRGTAEAGWAFALPTYAFVASIGVVLGIGVFKVLAAAGHPSPVVPPPPPRAAAETLTLWLLLRSFASGCTAMTGVEAVSNGVSAFREPTVKTAHRTLTVIVAVLAALLGGIALLARAYRTGAMDQEQSGYQSILSQLTGAVIGRGWFYYLTMSSVLATLCLSANTSFVDFPRLCRLIARDHFLPRAFAEMGRRLVYSMGILFLAAMAALLMIAFGGITDRLIPLFAVGAFLAFTLSQAGMVIHWRRQRGPGGAGGGGGGGKARHVHLWVNGLGAVTTGAALAIIVAAKFAEGAWLTLLAIPALLALFRLVHRHYQRVERQVQLREPLDLSHNQPPVVLIPIRRWDKLTAKALRFALHVSTDVVGIHLSNLSGDAAAEEANEMRRQWEEDVVEPCRRHGIYAPRLELVRTPYRRFAEPVLEQIDRIKRDCPERLVSVVIPDVVPRRWWQIVLHGRRAVRLRAKLLKRGDHRVVVIELPWFVNE